MEGSIMQHCTLGGHRGDPSHVDLLISVLHQAFFTEHQLLAKKSMLTTLISAASDHVVSGSIPVVLVKRTFPRHLWALLAVNAQHRHLRKHLRQTLVISVFPAHEAGLCSHHIPKLLFFPRQ